MLKLDWNKLNPKQREQIKSIRPLNLLLGGIEMTQKAFSEFVTKHTSDGATLIIGVLNNSEINGLEGAKHFQPFTFSQVEKYLNDLIQAEKINPSKVAILKYDFENSKYVLRELNPDRVFRVNGSGANVIHYQQIFWDAYSIDKKIEQISPYFDEKEAKVVSSKKYQESKEELELKTLQGTSDGISDKYLKNVLLDVLNLSWDWTGRTSALIVENSKLISWGENRVLGYPGYMLHNGSLREINKASLGENLEYGETVHAEQEAILKAVGKVKSFENCTLYTSKFMCPVCSRIVAASGIKKVVYLDEYTNKLGYKLVEMCGVEVERMN
jgi:dCMP deaminase